MNENRNLADHVRVEMLELLDQGCSFQSVLSRALKRIQEGQLPKIIQDALCLVPTRYLLFKGADSPPALAQFLGEYLRGTPCIDDLAWACNEMSPLTEIFEVIVSPEDAQTWIAEINRSGVTDLIAMMRADGFPDQASE